MGRLLDHGEVSDLDVSCTERMRRQPFLLNSDDFATYVTETILPMTQ